MIFAKVFNDVFKNNSLKMSVSIILLGALAILIVIGITYFYAELLY